MQLTSFLPVLLLPLTTLASPASPPNAALAPRWGGDDDGDDGDYGGDDHDWDDDNDDDDDDHDWDDDNDDDDDNDWDGNGHGHGHGKCLSDNDASQVVAAYVKLIADYDDATANKWLSNSFADYSDSINQLAGLPLGSATFPTKAAFMAAQAKNPKLPLTVDGTPIVDCKAIAIIWHTVFGAAQLSARGLSSIQVVWEDSQWKISRLDVEFNSLTWLLNVGGGYTLNGKKVGNVVC